MLKENREGSLEVITERNTEVFSKESMKDKFKREEDSGTDVDDGNENIDKSNYCTIMNNCYLRLRSTFSSLALEFGYKKALGASYEQNSFDRRLIIVIFVEKLL